MAVRSPASAALVTVLLELASLGVMVLIAGASNDAGNVMLIMIGGFWMVYLLKDTAAFQAFVSIFGNLESNPSNSSSGGSSLLLPNSPIIKSG
jgi:hypothetical protein